MAETAHIPGYSEKQNVNKTGTHPAGKSSMTSSTKITQKERLAQHSSTSRQTIDCSVLNVVAVHHNFDQETLFYKFTVHNSNWFGLNSTQVTYKYTIIQKWKPQQFYPEIYQTGVSEVVFRSVYKIQHCVTLTQDTALNHTKFELSRHETSTERPRLQTTK